MSFKEFMNRAGAKVRIHTKRAVNQAKLNAENRIKEIKERKAVERSAYKKQALKEFAKKGRDRAKKKFSTKKTASLSTLNSRASVFLNRKEDNQLNPIFRIGGK